MPGLPSLVFVHGSWHKPSCFDPIVKPLQEQHKLRCISFPLPSTSGDPDATFKNDVDAARDAITGETSLGRDVVVIAHSYGGMVGNSAIKGLTRPRDAAAAAAGVGSATSQAQNTDQSHGHVIGLILIASGFTLTGLSFMDIFLGQPPPFWRVNKATGYAELTASPRELFYHDLPTPEADRWVAQLTPQSLKSLFEGGEYAYAGWRDVPVWYIGTIEDRGLPVAMQRLGVGAAREMGACVEHRELRTSHSPFLSQPEETVALILEAVEAFTGEKVESKPELTARGKEVAVPEPRLWQPLTWYKFGLPLVFGHILGRCILTITWGRRLWKSRLGLVKLD